MSNSPAPIAPLICSKYPESKEEVHEFLAAPMKWLTDHMSDEPDFRAFIAELQAENSWNAENLAAFLAVTADSLRIDAMEHARKQASMAWNAKFLAVNPCTDSAVNCPVHKTAMKPGTACAACVESAIAARPGDMSEENARSTLADIIADSILEEIGPAGNPLQ